MGRAGGSQGAAHRASSLFPRGVHKRASSLGGANQPPPSRHKKHTTRVCIGVRDGRAMLGESTTFLLAALLRLRVAALGATLGCGTGREEAAPGCSERRAVRIGDFGRAPQPHRSLPLGVRWALRGSAAQSPECTAQPSAWRARHRETEQWHRGRQDGACSMRPCRCIMAASRKSSSRPWRRSGRSARTC